MVLVDIVNMQMSVTNFRDFCKMYNILLWWFFATFLYQCNIQVKNKKKEK